MVNHHPLIGVLGIQGAISEHVQMMNNVIRTNDMKSSVIVIREKYQLEEISGLIIPGGESTTISRFLQRKNIYDPIRQRTRQKTLSVMGTCAGCVLCASEIIDEGKDIKLLSLMDMKVQRNAFGRQRESFEDTININGLTNAFHAVFIRAPLILETFKGCIPLSSVSEGIVMAQQENVLGLSFHPELTNDTTIHEYFYTIVKRYQKQ